MQRSIRNLSIEVKNYVNKSELACEKVHENR